VLQKEHIFQLRGPGSAIIFGRFSKMENGLMTRGRQPARKLEAVAITAAISFALRRQQTVGRQNEDRRRREPEDAIWPARL
jgi:hypothetical protein